MKEPTGDPVIFRTSARFAGQGRPSYGRITGASTQQRQMLGHVPGVATDRSERASRHCVQIVLDSNVSDS
jgi:hypothetical protein